MAIQQPRPSQPTNSPSTPSPTAPDIPEIYRQLERGVGHEWVNDDNVQALIEFAVDRDNSLIEIELREWHAPCNPDTACETDPKRIDQH